MSKIQWTTDTWNPIVGCSKIATECMNCYAIPMSHRLAGIKATAEKYAGVTTRTKGGKTNFTGKVNFDAEALLKPLLRKKPTTYFVNSMSDLFHQSVPFEWIDKIMAVIALCPQHTFQVLTKRAERMRAYFEQPLVDFNIGQEIAVLWYKDLAKASEVQRPDLPLSNLWLGVSCGTQASANKLIPDLLACPAKVRFLSCEPLLEDMDLTNIGHFFLNPLLGQYQYPLSIEEAKGKIDWVIVGGESGKGARPMHPDWVRSIREQCAQAGTAFFFKQWGEWMPADSKRLYTKNRIDYTDEMCMVKVGKHEAGRLLDGVEYNEMPQP